MEVTINCSAKVQLSDTTIATLHTIFYGGNYKWSGLVLEITGKDELGLNVYKAVGDTVMSEPLKFWITPEEAIHDAIAQFYTESAPAYTSDLEARHANGTCDDNCNWCLSGMNPEDSTDMLRERSDAASAYLDRVEGRKSREEEGDYSGEWLPTGWDAQDHKAMYE